MQVARGAKLLAYSFKPEARVFRLTALKDNLLVVYEEELPYMPIVVKRRRGKWVTIKGEEAAKDPAMREKGLMVLRSRKGERRRFNFGVTYWVTPLLIRVGEEWIVRYEYRVEASELKRVAERELEVSPDNVVEGEVTIREGTLSGPFKG